MLAARAGCGRDNYYQFRLALGCSSLICTNFSFSKYVYIIFGYPIHYVFLVATARVRNPHCNLHYLATIVTFKNPPQNPSQNPPTHFRNFHYFIWKFSKKIPTNWHFELNLRIFVRVL